LTEVVIFPVLAEVTVLALAVEAEEDSVAMATVHKCTTQCVPTVVMIARSHFALLAIALFTARTVLVVRVATIALLARIVLHSTEGLLRLLHRGQIRQFANFLRKLTRLHRSSMRSLRFSTT
jgi:hypothetical protein